VVPLKLEWERTEVKREWMLKKVEGEKSGFWESGQHSGPGL